MKNFFARMLCNYRAVRSWGIMNWVGNTVEAFESACEGRDIEAA